MATHKEQLTYLITQNSGLKKTALLVSIYLGTMYSSDFGCSRCSMSTIVEQTGLSRRTVLSAVHEIIASGEWLASKSNGSASSYYPVLEKLAFKQSSIAPMSRPTKVSVESGTSD